MGRPRAAVMPIMIGITAPTRAVAEGMNSASTKPTIIAPSVSRAGEMPTRLITSRATRRSSPVCLSATARNSAAATSSTAVEEKPPSMAASASADFMGRAPGVSDLPISPSTAAPVRMTALLAGDTHSLIHNVTTSTKRPSATCPAGVRPAGVGSSKTPM